MGAAGRAESGTRPPWPSIHVPCTEVQIQRRRLQDQRSTGEAGACEELPWSRDEIEAIRARLLDYFDRLRRPLPWRLDPDPYRILVSEVMSQQTRLEAVVPYYRRWIRRFPDPAALAAADEEEVLSLWEGLGYYSRARNLLRAARELEARYGGRVPEDPEELRTLPGVGPYTAGAVASIAFDVPVPAVDGNVRRVLSRLLDEAAPTPARLERWAGALVDPGRPGDFNQAVMELGATVCTPRSPRCDACPVAAFCRARPAGTQEERPAPRRSREIPEVVEAAALLVTARPGREPRVLLRRRPREGLLGGMWEVPGEEAPVPGRVEEVAGRLAGELGRRAGAAGSHGADGLPGGRALPAVRHAFSHLKVTYRPFLFILDGEWGEADLDGAAVTPGSGPASGAGGGSGPTMLRWVVVSGLDQLPIPVAQRRILRRAMANLPGDVSPK